jgi:predicted phage-related endonuclease
MLWLEKTGRIERPASEAMEWGTLLEPVVFERLRDLGYDPAPFDAAPLTDSSRPFVSGRPDGFEHSTDETRLLEVKTAGQWAHRGWEGVPLHYAAQVQWYLHLTGLHRALLAVLVGGQRLELHEIDRDERASRGLLNLAERFWTKHLLRDVPPAPDSSESSREALAAMFPEATAGKVVRLTGSAWKVYEELRTRRAQLDVLKAQTTALENMLKATMGDAERAIGPRDEDAIRWTTATTKRVDVTRLRRDRPDVAAEYETATPTRRFQVL